MKCFEKILKSRILNIIALYDCQFVYKKNLSTKDACISIEYFLTVSPGTTIKFCSNFTFNTIVPKISIEELKAMSDSQNLLTIIEAFLVDRPQSVHVGSAQFKKLSCDIGCPQGCVSSPVLFSVYTDFFKSTVIMLRFLNMLMTWHHSLF